MAILNWKSSREDALAIGRIVEKAATLVPKLKAFAVAMDLTACHLHGCPLDLAAMESGSDLDLLHDFVGIARHLDRQTGKLTDCFLPRFAAK